jgi:predicted nucleic acid-binding protein
MIILDASFIIAHLNLADSHHSRAEELLLAAGVASLGASALTLADVLVEPTQRGQAELTSAILRKLKVVAVPVDGSGVESLARLRGGTRLKLPDCCVIHAAEQTRSDTIATFDERLAKVAQERGLNVLH